jgi:DNA invertase Pin-like site-specific DNA recombinase
MPRRINFGSRLTLNVLLSFAQFEREVTSERIRDEISASKRKGLWVGGLPSAAARRSKPRRRFIARVEIEREQVVIKLADPSGNQSHDGSATSFFVCRSKSQTRLADAR